jgi:hypothetical protein
MLIVKKRQTSVEKDYNYLEDELQLMLVKKLYLRIYQKKKKKKK